MNEKYAPGIWQIDFVEQNLTTEPFEVSAGKIKVSKESKSLYYVTPMLNGKRYRVGLGDLYNALNIKYKELLTLEEASELLSGHAAQFLNGLIMPISLKKKKGKKVA